MEGAAPAFDLRTIEWEFHPLLQAVRKHRYPKLIEFLANERKMKFGMDGYVKAKTERGETPLMLHISDINRFPPAESYRALQVLLEKFRLDPNAWDSSGKNALMYALLYGADKETIKLLLKNGADPRLQDHHQLSGFVYAASLFRTDILQLICPGYREKTSTALQLKFINMEMWGEKMRASSRKDRLEIPAPSEGSPKRYAITDSPPQLGALIRGIQFRISPSSPASSTSPLSIAVNNSRPSSGNRRTSEDKTYNSSASKSSTMDTASIKVIRRVCSTTFDSRLYNPKSGVLQFAQLIHNLRIYCEEVDYVWDKTPEPLDAEKTDVLAAEMANIDARRVSLPAASAPILIKSRSVEDSINKQPYDLTTVMIRALPRESRKNALMSGHLIERQGSAPQLQLKRRPYGVASGESSGSLSPADSLTRNVSRQQINSPLAGKLSRNK